MADIVVTQANVQPGTGASYDKTRVAGETITAGQSVYLKSTDSKLYRTLAAGTAEQAQVLGVAEHGALAGQPVAVQISGQITIGGATVTAGIYVASANAGGIAPLADLVSTNYMSIVGYAINTTILQLIPTISGVQK